MNFLSVSAIRYVYHQFPSPSLPMLTLGQEVGRRMGNFRYLWREIIKQSHLFNYVYKAIIQGMAGYSETLRAATR